MEDNKSLSIAMQETISSDHLNVIGNIGEVFLDSALNDGVLKDVPIISSIVGVGKCISNIQDYFFVKKLISFLIPIKDTEPEERRKAIKKWEEDAEYRINVGEALLGMVHRCDDSTKAKWLSELFYELVLKRQWPDIFMRTEKILSSISVMDMLSFLKQGKDEFSTIDAKKSEPYLGTGLYGNATLVWQEASSKGSGHVCEVTEAGYWIYNILNHFPAYNPKSSSLF